jgi:tetratricopeptide (TPR) repeat protein
LFRKALDGMQDKPADAPVVLMTESFLINMYYAAGKLDRAESVLRNLLALLRQKADADWFVTASITSGLGLYLLKQKKFAEAEPLLRDSLVIYEKAKAPAWTMAHIRSLVGAALLGQKQYAEAEPLLRDACLNAAGRARSGCCWP